MLNQVVRGHKAASPDCDGLLDWDMGAEERRGLTTILIMRCMICDYGSTKYKLYQGVHTKALSRKAATSNLGRQIGLSQTPLGNDGIWKILLSTNTPAPSRKTLQKSSNTVMSLIKALNESDMSRRCRQLVDVNTLRGCDSPNAVAVQCDGMYNNPLYSGVVETPFQPAIQTVYSMAEIVTSKKQIIKLVTKNKICSRHGHLLGEGHVDHSSSPGVCGANLPMQHTTEPERVWQTFSMRTT